jgi:hypothetical protein
MDSETSFPGGQSSVSHRSPGVWSPSLVVGLLLILAGGLLTLDRFGILEAGDLLRFWPIAPIAIGLLLLTQRRDAAGRFWGGFWVLVGTWLLLRTLGIVRVGFFELLVPAILVLVGFRLVMHAIRPGTSDDGAGPAGDANLVAILSETKRMSLDNPFRGGHMSGFMGGCVFDLRQAVIPPGGTAVIEVYGLMSGHELVVPSGWKVETNVVPIMAGVEDKRLPAIAQGQVPVSDPPRLVLRGWIMMSGITIKS